MKKDHITYEVLGAICLFVGAEIPKKLKNRIISWAKKDERLAHPERECSPGEREKEIISFLEKIRAHKPGQKTKLKEESLFQKMAEAIG